uniref:Reverse transcriptase domain-containing protein n=1 Tax=Tanacetum cinerariifolium TaxID=118510 RepID=A0A699HCK1_TANCI|nr:reverse transcriptase domain-containing protein [Tanacetum cinerariifolium]
MANTTLIVTTVTKPATNPKREKRPRDADATPRVNIPDFCEEYYEDIMPIIMDKIRRDKRKEVHARTGTNHGYRYRDRDRSHHVKRGRDSKSPLSRVLESGSSDGGNWKSKSKRHKPTDEDELTMPWMCEEVDSFTPRIRNFKSSRKTRMPNNVKTYDRTGDSEDHVKFFQAKAHVKRWAMPTWCHMFNSTLIGAARKSTTSSKKDGETIEDFMERFKVETGRMKGAPECMGISRFIHGVNNPELTKCLNEHVPNTMKEIMITTTAFIREEAAAAGKNKSHTSWRTHDQSKRHTSEKMYDFRVEKRSGNKFCDFHNDKGHSTDECMQLKKHIEELVRADKLSHLIKEINQGWDQSKVEKKEAPVKDKSMAIYMIQSWQRMTRQKVTQSFKRVGEIVFPSLATNSGTEGPLVIEAKIGRYMIDRMYVDGGSSTEALGNNRRRRSFYKSMDEFHDSHIMLKFLADEGIVIIRSTILIPDECVTVNTSSKEIPTEAGVRPKNFKVALHPNFPDQEVAIEWTLSAKGRTELCSLLKENLDIFTWQPLDMTRVPRSVAEHRLNIREGYSLVRQKKTGQAPERVKAIQAEVQKLVEARIMREVYYHDWLSNIVMVKKHDGSWRMTITKMEHHAGRTQYHIPAKDVGERTGPSGFPRRNARRVVETQQEPWTLFTDGSSCVDGSGAGLILTSLEGTEFTYELRFQFIASNNEAEYEALIAGLRITAQMEVRNVHVSVDSKLVANQVLGAYVAKEENMIKYLEKVKRLLCALIQIGLGRNTQRKIHPREGGDNRGRGKWTNMDDTNNRIFEKWTLPSDRKEASKLRIKAQEYELLEGVLYRRSFLTPWLRCVGPLQADYVIREIHEGSCSMHAGPRFMVVKAIRLGYYWPTIKWDAREAVIPAEIGMLTYRTAVVDAVHNDEELRLNLDLLEKRRERDAIREAKAKLKMRKYYNARVRGVTFRPGDFVYRSKDASHAVDRGKLGPKWEGPYDVMEALGDGAYKLRSAD